MSKLTRRFDFDAAVAVRIANEVAKVLMQKLPEMKQITSMLVESVFIPKAIARQFALLVVLETGRLTAQELVHVVKAVKSRFSSRSRLIRQLERQQDESETQDEWMDLAEQIDAIQGNDTWRAEAKCKLYESDRISARIDEFVHLMRRRDIFDLMFTLRGGINRGKFGLLHEGLFTRALAGTKVLVETYHNVVCASLDFVCDAPVLPEEAPIPTEARLAFFNETRHAYGRTAIMFSGGAALGFYHVGVAKALMENGLMPRVLSGASAGSILCSMLGTRTNEECFRDFFNVKGTDAPGHSGTLKLDFVQPIGHSQRKCTGTGEQDDVDVLHSTNGTLRQLKRVFQSFVPATLRKFTSIACDVLTGKSDPRDMLVHDTENLRTCCRINIGNFTFQEAFDRTGKILNITVSPLNRSDPPRLLNYLTAPHVLVWSAAVASSSLPGVFESNRLLVKDPDGSERFEREAGMRFLDGSMEADLPMQQLSEMFNINHFIISQANPHAVMFSSLGKDRSIWSSHVIGIFHGVLVFLQNQLKAWMRNAVEMIGGRRVAPLWEIRRGFLTQFFTQEYVGRETDITLNPWAGDRSLFSAFVNLLNIPSEEEFLRWIEAAERETWRHIPRLKSHCTVEMTLDSCVQRLRKRVLAESWEAKRMSQPTSESTQEKMGQRVPSFFVSPSLVNLGGLGVSDQSNIKGWSYCSNEAKDQFPREERVHSNAPPQFYHHAEVLPGWGGLGLQGNRSASNLSRNSSGSGLFIMDTTFDEEDGKQQQDKPRELTERKHSSLQDLTRSTTANDKKYVKTTNMANFYYRNCKSHDDLVDYAVRQEQMEP